MEIEIEFLTPGFLYGASHQRPEFRIPSLLGQMRYWWRMTQDWNDVKEMRDREAAVFGLGEQGAKPFHLYIRERPDVRSPQPSPLLKNGQPEIDRTTRKPLFKFPTNSQGIAYFFYPFMRHVDRFSWIPPGYKISLEFDPTTKDVGILNQLFLSMFLFGCFGGLGARSRRGAGSVKINIPGCSLFHLTDQDLFNFIRRAHGPASQRQQFFFTIQTHSPLSIALQNEMRYRTNIQPENNWERTLGSVGDVMHGMRTRHRMLNIPGDVDPTFLAEARQLHAYFNDNGRAPRGLTKDAFGLPRIINFPEKMNALTVAPYKKTEEMRRSSPLHISVNRNGNGQHYCTALILWDGIGFLPDDIDIHLKKGAETTTLELPGPEKLEAFLGRL